MKKQNQFIHHSFAALLACGLIASLLPGLVAAQDNSTFYVGGAGASDRNPGTATEPFATIQKAANMARSGDVVKIRDGIYREGHAYVHESPRCSHTTPENAMKVSPRKGGAP